MQFFRGLEERGRAGFMRALKHIIPTPRVAPLEVGNAFRQGSATRVLLMGIYQHMGQFLCATPLIRALKVAWPQATLDFLGNPVNSVAARANPQLDRVWTWDKHGVTQWPSQWRALRAGHYDLVLILTTERPSATAVLMARSLGARWVAATTPTILEPWAQDVSRLCSVQIPASAQKNEVAKFLDIASAFGVEPQGRRPEFVPESPDIVHVNAFFNALQLEENPKPLVGLFIGGKTERADRLWPVAYVAQLADRLAQAGMRVIALSPPPPSGNQADTFQSDEYLRLEEFRKALKHPCPIFQEAELGRVAAFIQRLDLFISPDGGILHLAASVGASTLGLFFATDPEVWRHDLPQAIIDGRGKPASELKPETVAQEAIRFLGQAARR